MAKTIPGSMKSAKAAGKKSSKKVVDTNASADISSATHAANAANPSAETPATSQEQTHTMGSISLVRSDKDRKSTNAVFTAVGYQGGLKIAKSYFKDRNVPATLVISSEDGTLADPRVARAKMTAEERKAARAAAPKLTPAEKLAKIEESRARMEKRAEKLRASLAAAAAAPPASA